MAVSREFEDPITAASGEQERQVKLHLWNVQTTHFYKQSCCYEHLSSCKNPIGYCTLGLVFHVLIGVLSGGEGDELGCVPPPHE